MTDEETIDRTLALFEQSPGNWGTIHRNGKVLLALPADRRAALRALKLYHPQRFKARAAMAATWLGTGLGLHRHMFPAIRHPGGIEELTPDFARAMPFTTGILLGSPEHRVRRAIASFLTSNGWEVAKIAFGKEGAQVLEQEAEVMQQLQAHAKGTPRLFGLHHGNGVTLLRMPYLTGKPIAPTQSAMAMRLLEDWKSPHPPKPASAFPEWEAIVTALSDHEMGHRILLKLSQECLTPGIRHGDFARWNLLRQSDGTLMAIDWEWGHMQGMPGLDLVHYFLQDHRLVNRLPNPEAINATLRDLSHPDCMTYLRKAGWSENMLLPIIASLAWKEGAGHQDNAEILMTAVAADR